ASSTTYVTKTVTATPASPAVSTSGLSAGDIYRNNVNGIVEITDTINSGSGSNPFGGGGVEQAQGTGFVIDAKGDIVTNAHVVAGASHIVVQGHNGTTYPATLVGTDTVTDVAVIRVSPSAALQPVSFGNSSAVRVGDPVVAIGDPFGLSDTLTAGVVSALNRTITSPSNHPITGAIQTDAAINHGNSGGPLFNSQGQVVGITSQIYGGPGATNGNVGIGFAVPSNTVRSVVNQLLTHGKAAHGFLGVYLDTVTPEVANATGMPVGAEVVRVKANSPAAKAGLHGPTGSKTVGGVPVPTGGDVITAVNGQKVTSTDDVVNKILAMPPGQKVTLTVVHDGQSRTVTVTLGSASS
ncbi:MAG: S1C family serine protease, partial [Gaiellales bacterium]